MKSEKDRVWDKAKKIPGKNPNLYRKDPYDNEIYKAAYGKNSPKGWDIDHIKPKSKGGSESIRNKQALSAKINRNKGDSLNKRSRHSKGNK
jgi:5-methylcytosine-specific restriction endonuclease McrA